MKKSYSEVVIRKAKNAISTFLSFLMTGPINTVSLIPVLFGVLILIFWVIVKKQIYPTSPPIYNYFVLMVFSIIIGFVGIIYILRKEMPGPLSSIVIRGKLAVIVGILLVMFFWILGVFSFVSALMFE